MVRGIDQGAWPSVLRAHGSAGDGGAKKALKSLRPEALAAKELAGEPIQAKLTHAPGNGADIGGLESHRAQWLVCRAPLGHRRFV